LGASAIRCNRLQGLTTVSYVRWWCFAFAMLFAFVKTATAQIMPVHTTIAFSASIGDLPVVKFKKPDGAVAYELTLRPDKIGQDTVVFDIVLRRTGIDHNLLQPRGNWHGYREFMIGARDMAKGPDKSIYGASRAFHLMEDNLNVECKVLKVETRSIAKDQSAFELLVLEIVVDNAK